MSKHPVLRPDVKPEDIQDGLTLEHLVDNSRTTMDRLFSSSLRVLVESTIALTKATAHTIEQESLKHVRHEFARDIEVIAPHTKALTQEGGSLPYEDPTFILAVCNLFVNMVTVVEHVTKEMENEAIKDMVDHIKTMVGAIKEAGGGEAVVLSGSPEEVVSALQQMGQQGMSGASPATATTDEVGKPPAH